jgi:hypothetical protein
MTGLPRTGEEFSPLLRAKAAAQISAGRFMKTKLASRLATISAMIWTRVATTRRCRKSAAVIKGANARAGEPSDHRAEAAEASGRVRQGLPRRMGQLKQVSP